MGALGTPHPLPRAAHKPLLPANLAGLVPATILGVGSTVSVLALLGEKTAVSHPLACALTLAPGSSPRLYPHTSPAFGNTTHKCCNEVPAGSWRERSKPFCCKFETRRRDALPPAKSMFPSPCPFCGTKVSKDNKAQKQWLEVHGTPDTGMQNVNNALPKPTNSIASAP